MKVKLNTVNENPFYGMKNSLKLFHEAGKITLTKSFLDSCYQETIVNGRPDLERKQMFFSLLFSIGDISTREHNIFKGNKVDSGGNSLREAFRLIMLWMREKHPVQYNKFLYATLFSEFTTFDNLFASRVVTKKKTNKVLNTIDMLGDDADLQELANVISTIIKGSNFFKKQLVAKYLVRPRLSKRQGHKNMLPQTKALMKKKEQLLVKVSDLCDFPYEQRNGYIHFSGYYEWRKRFNSLFESVLFSSGEVANFDKPTFLNWLDKLPAGARLRVKNRILDKDAPNPKWGELGNWYNEWSTFKTKKQKEQRVLEEQVRQGDKSEETIAKLETVKKEAKVTVGAVNFAELFAEIVYGRADDLKIQPFLDKVNLPYNTLVFVDDSGSMRSNGHPKYKFSAMDFAAFIATITLMKNPSDVGRSMMGLFSYGTRIIHHINAIQKSPNGILLGTEKTVSIPLYSPELTFNQNLYNMSSMLRANTTFRQTYISSIPERLKQWTEGDDAKIEMLQEFPVWTIITDGNFNSMPSPESSINDFMYKCQTYFGFKPFIVAFDVSHRSAPAEKFSGIENFIYVPPNPAQVEQLLTNFRDIDIMDVYTPLQSLFRSNRYSIIRENVV